VTTTATTTTTALPMVSNCLQIQTGRSQLDPNVIARYNDLPFPKDKILAEYVWVDAAGKTRSKTRTLPAEKVRDGGKKGTHTNLEKVVANRKLTLLSVSCLVVIWSLVWKQRYSDASRRVVSNCVHVCFSLCCCV